MREVLDSTRGIPLYLAICAGLQAQEQGRLDSSETLFSVMAAVNVGLPEPAPVVRDYIAGRKMTSCRNSGISSSPITLREPGKLVAIHLICPLFGRASRFQAEFHRSRRAARFRSNSRDFAAC